MKGYIFVLVFMILDEYGCFIVVVGIRIWWIGMYDIYCIEKVIVNWLILGIDGLSFDMDIGGCGVV